MANENKSFFERLKSFLGEKEPPQPAQTLYPQLNRKLLVIEDSGVIRKTIRDFLREDGFEIIEAKDGIQGLNLIRQVDPDLIILDYIIPRMSGWEVYQQIQADPELRSIPLIIMCGRKYEVSSQIPEPFEHFVFLSKPFDRTQLIEAIGLVTGEAFSSEQKIAKTLSDIEQLKQQINVLENKIDRILAILQEKLH